MERTGWWFFGVVTDSGQIPRPGYKVVPLTKQYRFAGIIYDIW